MGRRQRLEQTSAGTGRAALKPSQRASEPGGEGGKKHQKRGHVDEETQQARSKRQQLQTDLSMSGVTQGNQSSYTADLRHDRRAKLWTIYLIP